MKVLIATDHTFHRYQSGVYNVYCFDNKFFSDYRQVFESVEVIARTVVVDKLPSGARRSDGDGVQFIDVPNIHGLAWLLKAEQICVPLLKPAVEQADAIIVRVPGGLGWVAAKLARQIRKPYMIEVIADPYRVITGIHNGLHYRILAWLEARRLRKLAGHANVAAYVSNHHLQRAYPISPGTPYAGVSDIRLNSAEITIPKIFRAPLKPIKIIFVASLLPIKRHKDLIQACDHIRAQGGLAEIHFAGDGPCRQALEKLARQLKVDESVIFHGHVADKQALMDLLDTSDLFVLPSASEGLPRAVLEAMARGLPVVGTRIAGAGELVGGSELYPVGDTHALAKLIIDLAHDPERLTELSQYSINVAKQYTDEILSPRRVCLYKILREKAA